MLTYVIRNSLQLVLGTEDGDNRKCLLGIADFDKMFITVLNIQHI